MSGGIVIAEGKAATVRAGDGTLLHCETRGSGPAIVFVHELSGSYRSFDLQVAQAGARHRCITFNARGYPPSAVPAGVESYGQDIAADDIGAVLDGLGLADAHLVGVSMGSASALQFALRQPDRVCSLTLASIGSGSDLKPGEYAATMEKVAAIALRDGMRALAESYLQLPNRCKLIAKNPAEYRNYIEQLSALSPLGITNTMRGVQARRPPIYIHAERIAALAIPALVIVGEDDEGCLKPSDFLNRTLPQARLERVPATGHAVNLEEPAAFNRLLLDFIDGVERQM